MAGAGDTGSVMRSVVGCQGSVVSRDARFNHEVEAEMSWISSGVFVNPDAIASTQRSTDHEHDLIDKNCERKNLNSRSELSLPCPSGILPG